MRIRHQVLAQRHILPVTFKLSNRKPQNVKIALLKAHTWPRTTNSGGNKSSYLKVGKQKLRMKTYTNKGWESQYLVSQDI